MTSDSETDSTDDFPAVFWRVTGSEHTILCAIENGLTTSTELTGHTSLDSKEVHRDLLRLWKKDLVAIHKPENWVMDALAAAEDKDEQPLFRPAKQVQLTMKAEQYFGWAQTNAEFDPLQGERIRLGAQVAENERRIAFLEQWMRDQMKPD